MAASFASMGLMAATPTQQNYARSKEQGAVADNYKSSAEIYGNEQ
jgi:hypothetical protein